METLILKKEVEPMLVAMGKFIRQRRIAMGLSQEELAARAGLHRTYISDVERGIRNLTVGALWFLSHGLQLQLQDIVGQMENRVANEKSMPVVHTASSETASAE